MATAKEKIHEWAVQITSDDGVTMILPAPNGPQDAHALAVLYADQNAVEVIREVTAWKPVPVVDGG